MKVKSNRGLAAALISSTALVAPALALMLGATSAAAAPASDSTEVKEVVVTGTLFRTKVETASPVTQLSQEKLQKAGITTITDAVRSVSADNSGSIPTAFGQGFAVGSSGVALRGLTVNSTLVLIDGYRTANYALADDGERAFVDLNTIPESIVDHVDVLKDGASSLYGADAIGGVVNIIMKPTFVGEDVSVEGGTSQHGGGSMYRFTGTAGFGDLDTDRYNAYLNFEYQHDDPIRVGQRGYPFNSFDYSPLGGTDEQGGQPGNFSGSIYGSVADATTGGPTQVLAPGGCGKLGKLSSDTSGNVYCEQNLTLYGDDAPEETRYGFYGRFTARINPNTTAYFNASYYQNEVYVHLAPPQINSTVPNNTDSIALPARFTSGPNMGQLNPNDPFAMLGDPALINYAFGDIPSYAKEENHVFRAVLDLKGFAYGWDYEAAAVVAHTWLDTTNAGYINYNQLLSDIGDGSYSFIDPASNTAAVRKALAPALRKTSTTDLDTINFQASHDLFELPGGEARFAFGGSWRYEGTKDPDLNPDLSAQGLGIAHTIGNRNVSSGFYEVDLPVLKQLDINQSGRFDHYSDFGNNFSPKIGVKWTPIKQIALRATYSLGFRAPSFSENGSSAAEGFANFSPDSTDPAQEAFILAHGGDAYVTNEYSLATLTEANPKIKPEQSESYTIGAVIQPIKDISLSIDYYHIKKTNVIAQPNIAAALDAYFEGQTLPTGVSIIPDAADPNAPPGTLARPAVVVQSYINADSLITDGIDIDVRFHHNLPWNVDFTSDFAVTDVFNYLYTEPGSPTLNYVGLQSPYETSSGAGTPKWRWSWQNSFTKGPFNLTATIYYVSSMKMIALDAAGPDCAAEDFNGLSIPDCREDAFVEADLHGSYQVNEKLELYADIDNVADAKPPFDPINYAGVNYNPTYAQDGIVGRYFKLGVRAKF
jgi:iron complex outermembrane receptor protein